MEYVNLSRDLAVGLDANTSDRDEFLLALQDVRRHEDTNSAIKTESLKYLPPIGLALNVIFLFTVARVKSMHTIVNIYLANLALADSTFLATTLAALRGGGMVYKAILQSLANLTVFASFFFVSALAFERFFAICHPLTFRAAASKARAAKIVAALWLTAVIGGVGSYFSSDYGEHQVIFISGVLVAILYAVVLLSVAVLYACVVKKLQQRPTSTSTDRRQRLAVGRVVFMLIVNTAVFFSLITLNIVSIVFALVIGESKLSPSLIKAEESYLDVLLTSEIMTLINASINPLVYSGLNADYRAAVVEAFSFLCPKGCTCLCQGSSKTPVAQIELGVIKEPTRG